MTKHEMLNIVNYLDDLNHKLLVMGSWEGIWLQTFVHPNIDSIDISKYSDEFKSIFELINDDREVLVPILPGKIINEFKLIDKIISNEFGKRIHSNQIRYSGLAYNMFLQKNSIKSWTIKEIRKRITKSNDFDLYHIYRGLYENKFPTRLEYLLKHGNHSYLEMDENDVKGKSNFVEVYNLSNNEIKNKAQKAKGKPKSKECKVIQYDRDQYVVEYTRRKSNGICELCGNEAPFKNSKGEPYLEVHHIVWLSRGGDDTIENTAALCPNCHRKMHIINLKEDVEYLKNKKI